MWPRDARSARFASSRRSPRNRGDPENAGDWISYGGTNWSQKYSPLDQITRDNFNDAHSRVDVDVTRLRDRQAHWHDDQPAAHGNRPERHAARRERRRCT